MFSGICEFCCIGLMSFDGKILIEVDLLEMWCFFLDNGVNIKVKDDNDRFFVYLFVNFFYKLFKMVCEGINFFYENGCVINVRDVDGNILLYLWVGFLFKEVLSDDNFGEVGGIIILCGGVINVRNDDEEILFYFV